MAGFICRVFEKTSNVRNPLDLVRGKQNPKKSVDGERTHCLAWTPKRKGNFYGFMHSLLLSQSRALMDLDG